MNEKHLISGLNSQNKVVFDFIFNYYYSGLCAYARRWVTAPDIAEDLVQDFFVWLWIDGSSLKINTSLKSYLFTAVKNKAVNHLKHVRVKEQYGIRIMQEIREHDYAGWEFSEPELIELIEQGLEKLPPRCREIFIMSRFEGKDNAAIAETLKLSKRTVELQISNALKVLRTELKDYLPSALLLWIIR
ncbi:MAG: RNA polymerase sigma-70 factor [Prolixibacteraceae bacterium]